MDDKIMQALKDLRARYPQDDEVEIWVGITGQDALHWTVRLNGHGYELDGVSGWGDSLETALPDCIRRADLRQIDVAARRAAKITELKSALKILEAL